MPSSFEALTEPSYGTEGAAARREASVVAALLLILMVAGGVFLIVEAALQLDSSDLQGQLVLATGAVLYLVLVVAYILTRKGRVQLGASLLVGAVTVGTWGFIVINRSTGFPISGAEIIISATVAVALLQARGIFVVHGSNLTFLVANQIVFPAALEAWAGSILLYLVAAAALTIRKVLTDFNLKHMDEYLTEWRAVMATSDCGIVSLDSNYRIRAFNHNATELAALCGLPKLEKNASAFEIFPPAAHHTLVEMVAPALGGQTLRSMQRVEIPGQDSVHVAVTVKPMTNSTGRTVGASMQVRDVTQEVRIREETERRLAKTRAAVLNAASHEINTPLTPLVIQLSLFRQGHLGEVTQAQSSALDTMDRSVRHLRRNVQAFLQATRLEQAIADADWEEVNLSNLVDQWASGSKRVSLTQCDEEGNVFGDPELLRSALQSFMEAVLRWSPKEQVEVSLSREDGRVVVGVEDPNSSISTEDVSAMEELLGHDVTSVGYAGLLSLHMARRVVAYHGGEVHVYHEEGLRLEADLPASAPLPERRSPLQAGGQTKPSRS